MTFVYELSEELFLLNDHRLKGGGFGLRLKVAGPRLKP